MRGCTGVGWRRGTTGGRRPGCRAKWIGTACSKHLRVVPGLAAKPMDGYSTARLVIVSKWVVPHCARLPICCFVFSLRIADGPVPFFRPRCFCICWPSILTFPYHRKQNQLMMLYFTQIKYECCIFQAKYPNKNLITSSYLL